MEVADATNAPAPSEHSRKDIFMSPTHRHDRDRDWSREQYEQRDKEYEDSRDRDCFSAPGDAYRHPFGDSTNEQNHQASQGPRYPSRGYAESQDDGRPYDDNQRAGGRGRTGNYEPGFGSSRGYGGGQAHPEEPSGYGHRAYGERMGRAAHNSYDHRQGEPRGYSQDRSASWREDYGSTGRQYLSETPSYRTSGDSDGRSDAGFRGHGPKGYKRSDQRIQEDLNDRLTESASLDARDIELAVREGEVTLTGMVNSRFCKREAEDLADRISGVKHVQNNLRIKAQQTPGSSQHSASATTEAGSNTASFGTSSAIQSGNPTRSAS